MIAKLVEILSIPIMILNLFGIIVGGIWLAILGEWRLIGIGVFLMFTSHWIISISLYPNILLSGLAFYFLKKFKPVSLFIGYILQLYTNILIVGSCIGAFYICSGYHKGDIGLGYIPYLLWAWGMALGPWQYFASKELDNDFTLMTLFSASAFFLLFLLSIFINPLATFIVIVFLILVQFLILPIYCMYIANKMDFNY